MVLDGFIDYIFLFLYPSICLAICDMIRRVTKIRLLRCVLHVIVFLLVPIIFELVPLMFEILFA